MQAEQFGYRKSHFFFRFRQNSHAVETRLLFETCPSGSFPAAPVSGLSDLDALLLIVAVLVDDTELALGSVRCEATGVGWPLIGCACACDDGGACEDDTVGFRRNRPSWPRKLAPLSDGRLAAAVLFVMMRCVRLLIAAPSIYHASDALSPHMKLDHGRLVVQDHDRTITIWARPLCRDSTRTAVCSGMCGERGGEDLLPGDEQVSWRVATLDWWICWFWRFTDTYNQIGV